ncbi:glucose 1-dehydrogenase-like [Diadema antillarum]|uniref:glucose 1-dehydrogenase-like n=1 Tax=Diadema antillarum TaxID=105358 RepID=UPI003A856476
MGSFDGKVVLITGASSGIGAVTAAQFAEDGASVVLVGRNEERLGKTSQECLSKGLSKDKVLTIKAEMSKEGDVQRTIETTIKHFGRLDVLVNNAGVVDVSTILGDNLMESYDWTMNINVRSVLHLSKLAAPHLIATKGSIVNVSSICGKRSVPNLLVYNISKNALDHFTRVTAVELASKGVRVNAVSPGLIVTPIHGSFGQDDDQVRKVSS